MAISSLDSRTDATTLTTIITESGHKFIDPSNHTISHNCHQPQCAPPVTEARTLCGVHYHQAPSVIISHPHEDSDITTSQRPSTQGTPRRHLPVSAVPEPSSTPRCSSNSTTLLSSNSIQAPESIEDFKNSS